MSKLVKNASDWKKLLNEESYRVTRQSGTEKPFTGKYWDNKKNGEYRYYANGQSNQTCTQNDIGLNGQDGLNSAHLNITNISSSSAAGMFFVHDVNAALGFDAEL